MLGELYLGGRKGEMMGEKLVRNEGGGEEILGMKLEIKLVVCMWICGFVS